MADLPISLLPAWTTPATNDLLAIVDMAAGVTKKITVDDLLGAGAVVEPDKQIVYGTGAAVDSNANFVIDYTNGYMGVGDPAPSARLGVKGIGITSATYAIKFNNQGASPLLWMRDDGAWALGLLAANSIANQTALDVNINGTVGTVTSGSERIVIGGVVRGRYAVSLGWASNTDGHGAMAIGSFANSTAFETVALGYNMATTAAGAIMIGSDQSAAITNNIPRSFMIGLGGNVGTMHLQSWFVNWKGNVVSRAESVLTDGAHYDTYATNTYTIHNGLAGTPVSVTTVTPATGAVAQFNFALNVTLLAGDPVIPTGFTTYAAINGITYFIGTPNLSNISLSLYPTRADALAGTNPVMDAGTDTGTITPQPRNPTSNISGAFQLYSVAGQAWILPGSGAAFQIGAGGGGVTSVSGTANRITSTAGATPVIDIDAAYVGQTSITTLGTIGTGVWQGTIITPALGGTGINNSVRTLTITLNSGTLQFSGPGTTLVIGASASVSGANTGDQTLSGLGGANTALSNLAAVSINTSLLAQTGVDLGATLTPFQRVILYGTATYGSGNVFAITGLPTAQRSISLPDGTGMVVLEAFAQSLTNKTITASTNVLGGVTMTLGSDATGDVYYRNSGGVLTRLGVGANGTVLTLAAGLPSWAVPAAAAAGTLTGATLAANVLASSLTSVGTITTGVWSGTAIVETKGGTNQTTYVLGDTLYSSAANTLSKLTGNITVNRMVQVQVGDGALSAAPAWEQIPIGILSHTAGAGNGVASSTTTYAQFWFGASHSAEVGRQNIMPFACTIKNFYVRTGTAQSGTGNMVVTIRKNGAGTALTLTIAAGAAAGTFSNLVAANAVTIAAGDLLSVELVNAATATSATIRDLECGIYL